MYVIKDTLAGRVFPADQCSWEENEGAGRPFIRNVVFYGDAINGEVVVIQKPIMGVLAHNGLVNPLTTVEITP